MANVKNFGLVGVGSDLQLGKAGTRIVNNAGTFNLKAANGTTDAALTAAGITSSGDVTLTTGNLSLEALSGKISIGGLDVLQRHANGLAQVAGTAGLVLPAGSTAQRGTATLGQIRVNSDVADAATVEYYDGDNWVTLATGGSTGTLQAEIDAIEAALGTGVSTSGEFNSAAFTDAAAGATSFTSAINQVAAALAAGNTLDEILPGTAAGNVIYFDGTNWQQAAPGATSGVQGYDAGLAALAAKTTTGIMVQTGADTYESRSLVAPTEGLTITDADGVAGNPTFALSNDLAALEGLAGTGFAVRTGADTWAQRSITGTESRIVVTNGDGVASSPTIDLATVANSGTGTFHKVEVDAYGRVSGTTAVTTADITALVDATYVNVAGDTMTGNLNMGGFTVTGLAAPVNGSDAATKNYVDASVAGLTWKNAVHVVSLSDVPLTGTFAGLIIDGHTLSASDAGYRVLLAGQTVDAENGIYTVVDAGSGNYSLERTTDADAFNELIGATVFVMEGNTYASSGWTQSNHYLVDFAGQTWVQFSGSGAYTAGDGLVLSGNTFTVNMGAGITTLPTDQVGIDLYDAPNGALALTTTGSDRSTDVGAKLHLILDAAGGLAQTASGLKIDASSVTNAMLANSSIILDADSGAGSVSLGSTLNVIGTATQGIVTSTSGSNITITASDASTTQKGVASFADANFAVTSGAVSIKTGGVSNDNLINSSITFAGNAGVADAVALGETVTISSADAAITVTAGTDALSIQLNTVDVAHGGTGLTSVAANQVLFGAADNTVTQDADFAFDATSNTLTVGSATIAGTADGDVTITANGTNGDINLVPNGTGSVVVGPAGAGVISADADQTLTITGNNTLVLESTAGDVVMKLAAGTTDKVTVFGPTATQYATSLADADLVNKLYVDQAIQTGAASGSIKAVKGTVNLAATGTTNIGDLLPAGATILRVKVQVTAADTGTGVLEIGNTDLVGGYMSSSENDTQTVGMYVAETYVVEASSVQVIATVSGTVASGSATVFVEYQAA